MRKRRPKNGARIRKALDRRNIDGADEPMFEERDYCLDLCAGDDREQPPPP